MNIIKVIVQVLLFSTMSSFAKRNPIIKYGAKDGAKEYKQITFLVPRANGATPPVIYKMPMYVQQYDGNRDQVHDFVRVTMVQFRVLKAEYVWTDRECITTMRNQILLGAKAKDHWDEACDVGNGPDDPIDPNAPDPDDFEQVVTNFISEIADQETPGNVVWQYLRSLWYNDMLKKFARTPTDYLKQIKKVEKDIDELAIVAGTEPTEEMKKDYFIRSFAEFDLKWLEEVDNGGDNDIDTMSRKEVAKRLDAHLRLKVSKAKQELGRNDNGNNNGKRGSDSQSDGNQKGDQKRYKNGGGGYSKRNGDSKRGGKDRGGRGDRSKKNGNSSRGGENENANRRQVEPKDNWKINGYDGVWKDHVLNPDSTNFDWNESKEFMYTKKCGNCPWYKTIFYRTAKTNGKNSK